MKKGILLGAALCALVSCESGSFGLSDKSVEGDISEMPAEGGLKERDGVGGDEGGSGGQGEAGRLTAGEWKDLDHWDFWGGLMESEEFAPMAEYWGFYTRNRIAVAVENAAGQPVAGAKVVLSRGGKDIWGTKTDNQGRADLFVGLFQPEKDPDPTALTVFVEGVAQEGAPLITDWSDKQGAAMNRYRTDAAEAAPVADIAFLVDATGSMSDEIRFLKEDMLDILTKASTTAPSLTFRTAALFYRDEGDDYLVRHSDFSKDFTVTHTFVGQQEADGGGDYPEAVHTALEQGLQSLSWSESARTRLAFLILDAPAHYRPEVLESLHSSIETYARLGIRIIPVAASGVDKNTEFMCRYFAVSTGGTYVFLTDDSGIGGSHIEATVGDYQVEQLNELLLRLITEYTR